MITKYTKKESKEEIKKLVESFGEKLPSIKSGTIYKEANIEDEYIKQLFKFLNWNIANEGIRNIGDREFIVQPKGKLGKEPDYLLQLDSKPCFYMEAKHPKYDLFKEIKYIWQAYSYAYSTQSSNESRKVNFSLLTDFTEFRFFDCTFKTTPELVNNYVVIDWKYTDFIEKFDELWNIFEKENVRKGSLEKLFINEKKIKQNRIPPDKAFLNDLDNEDTGYRILLAKDIKKYNQNLSSEEITRIVQQILDRFIFIKVLSDREIEDDFLMELLQELDKATLKSEEGTLNESCKDLFERLHRVYNGDVFNHIKELDKVKLGNKTLYNIINSLLPENSRYNFKVLSVEILGTIYEQFLGKVVHATDKRVTIEDKPEVKEAGGVYYTPEYVVNYIVKTTVGEKLKECKSINDLLALKICDPACGSGSFLIGAYDYLINWTIEYFSKKKDFTKKELHEYVYKDKQDNIRLKSKLKREILKQCIYGVDIDKQAVEVTKMSLSLKSLEDTKRDELRIEIDLFNEKVLPDLKENIKCGNSLIGNDIYYNKNVSLFEEDSKKIEEIKEKINAFDWEIEFSSIKNNGGFFDCVIGNPPYITYALGHERKKNETSPLNYLIEKYSESCTYKINSFAIFYQKSLELLKNDSFCAMIVPGTLLINQSLANTRKHFLNNSKLINIVKLDFKVFAGAEMGDCSIVVLRKEIINKNYSIKTLYLKEPNFKKGVVDSIEKQMVLSSPDFRMYLNNINYKFLNNTKHLQPLENIAKFYNGIKTGDNKKFLSNKKNTSKHLPVLRGRDFNRYSKPDYKIYVLFDKKELWSNTDESKLLIKPKILIRQTEDTIVATLDTKGFLVMDTIHIIYESSIDIKVLLAIINSKTFNFLHGLLVPEKGKAFAEVKIANLKKIPVPQNISEIIQKQLTEFIDILFSVKTNEREKEKANSEIDKLVYELYDLSPEEIEIIKEAIK
jgi:hypothetical protein